MYTTNYTTKWVETKALKDNIAKNTTKFLYEHIIIQFSCLKVNVDQVAQKWKKLYSL